MIKTIGQMAINKPRFGERKVLGDIPLGRFKDTSKPRATHTVSSYGKILMGIGLLGAALLTQAHVILTPIVALMGLNRLVQGGLEGVSVEVPDTKPTPEKS